VGVIFFVIFQCFFPRLDKLAAERAPFPLATWVSLAYGILLFFFAAFPYAMVGKSPAVEGWTTRHALLSGLPMAIILVSLARFLFQQPKFIWRRVGYGALVFLVIAFSLRLAQNYLAWQSRWVKDKSVMLQLEASKAARQSSTLWIRDSFPLVGQEPYRYYEWSSMFTVIWGDESRIGLGDVRNRNQTLKLDFDRRLNLSEYNHNGCQALMTIQPVARNMPDAIQYFALKFFANHNAMDAYLREVAKVTVTVLDNQPRRCKVGTP
jgi:hypothetical protein